MPTPYSAWRRTVSAPVFDYGFTVNGNVFESQNATNAPVPLTADSSLLYRLQEEAVVKALGKLAKNKVDLSVAFLERKQSARMVQEWCASTFRLLKDLKKGRWVFNSGARSPLGKTWKWDKSVPRGWTPKAVEQWRKGEKITTLPNAWLTTRYGIAPSIMDIAGAVEAIEAADNGVYDRYTVTTAARQKSVVSTSVPWASAPTVGYNMTYRALVRRSTFTHHEASVRLDATVDNSTYLRLKDVGVTNPLLTAWEVLPYSFVLDWFIGVGDFLEAANAWTGGYTFKAGSATRFYDLQSVAWWKRDDAWYATQPWYTETHDSGLSTQPAIWRQRGFQRDVFETAPLPTVTISRNPLNFERMWDSLFLVSNLLGEKEASSRIRHRLRV
jgi:hypothetical protein